MYAKFPGKYPAGWLLGLIALCGLLLVGSVAAAPAGTRVFDKTTWQKLKKELPRPGVVVFTTTDCAYCPDVIEKLSSELKKSKSKATLAVVVMDGATQPESWLKDAHYRKADSLYIFEGQANALRFGIDPRWRGMTPYLAMFGRTGDPKFVVGTPSRAEIAELLKP